MERRMQERHDRDWSERGQYNKQGSMEEYNHQLYRRTQMTGQAREEEEEEQGGGVYALPRTISYVSHC